MNIVDVMKKINRRIFIEKYALTSNNKRVVRLRRIEKAVKRHYNITTDVIYVDIKYRNLLVKNTVRGYYYSEKNIAVVFVNNDYVSNMTTLCHELTHAYQDKHMHDKYIASIEKLRDKKTTYAKAWHEVHARTEASAMCAYFLDVIAA